ncbi:hypothetical protein AYO44_06350 [Planctomycetaceae bacterium SCGC AG-212-F19]|nr:hypothetical protein AYO44_06350 [Planctomycetaceae bacterium SCGC AG-212-F19]
MATGQLDTVMQHLRRTAFLPSGGPLPDANLLDCFIQRQDEAAFEALVRRHGPMVLGVCHRVLGNAADAEDAFQATFLVLVRKASSIMPRGMVGNWLYGVATNTALKARGASVRRRAKEREAATMRKLEVPDDLRNEVQTILDGELRCLPEKYRAAIVLCDLEGKTRQEAARQLNWAEGTVASRLVRGRMLLSGRLARRGVMLSAGALGGLLAQQAASASVPNALVNSTLHTAFRFAVGQASGIGAPAALAEGVMRAMLISRLTKMTALVLALVLATTGALFLSAAMVGDDPGRPPAKKAEPQPGAKDKSEPNANRAAPGRSCIILWMAGGPSQQDTFDLKAGGDFKEIETAVKDVKITEQLPRLAKVANHLAIIRSMIHDEGDHNRAAHLMRTGYKIGGQDYPTLGCVLGKELGEGRPNLPRYLSLGALQLPGAAGYGPGFLGPQYGPLIVGERGFGEPDPEHALKLPAADVFEALAKGKGDALRKAVAKAFDLADEKDAVRDAYGRGMFGQSCLLARRLVETGVPVVEVTMPGWDTHAGNFDAVKGRCGELDAGWATLMTDLAERKLLDRTLIVWAGEFGRTPLINQGGGRDHWSRGFSVVLAGGGIKGGQAIGKTTADGTTIDEQPVSPAELFATIYTALGIDPTKENRTPDGQDVPLVGKGIKPVREALR